MEYMYIYTSRIKITKIKPQNLSERIKEIFTKYQAPLLKVWVLNHENDNRYILI